MLQTVKGEVTSLLAQLPDDCSLEDMQYHLMSLKKSIAASPPSTPKAQCHDKKLKSVWKNGLSCNSTKNPARTKLC